MAMTKKEQAAFDAALSEARVLGALRWTSPVFHDLDIPGHDEPDTSGWTANYGRVAQGWSSSIHHGSGAKKEKYNGSQLPQRLYSTRLLALRGLRHEMELRFAKELANIDKQIAEESSAARQEPSST